MKHRARVGPAAIFIHWSKQKDAQEVGPQVSQDTGKGPGYIPGEGSKSSPQQLRKLPGDILWNTLRSQKMT